MTEHILASRREARLLLRSNLFEVAVMSGPEGLAARGSFFLAQDQAVDSSCHEAQLARVLVPSGAAQRARKPLSYRSPAGPGGLLEADARARRLSASLSVA